MSESNHYHVVVVDDVVRFALHVWRYLSRSLGFGIGGIEAQESQYFRQGDLPAPLWTADRRGAVWWVSADSGWRFGLEAIRRQMSEYRPTLFLLDVKPRHEASPSSGAKPYDADDVAEWLAKRWPQPDRGFDPVMLVSSYAGEQKRHKVWPKSPDTLQKVADTLPVALPLAEINDDKALDILVTGAGFEFRYRHRRNNSGAEPLDVCFGLPETGSVLATMGSPFGDQIKLESSEEGFPWPCDGAFSKRYIGPFRQMKSLAEDRNLDGWWDLLLETELKNCLGAGSSPEDRRELKRAARNFEIGLRDAYRHAILRFDWGHMNQSIRAAQLPWHAWLTTNYTRFANRALTLCRQAKERQVRTGSPTAPREQPKWHVVSTASEAMVMMKELQDLEEKQKGRGGGQVTIDSFGYRPLFKLHGDISHLQTMAIAGHDKDLFNMLSLPVDGLQLVYNSAEKYLLQGMDDSPKEMKMRWHIVGHGLQDASLVNLLVHVAKNRKSREMIFRVVDPKPDAAKQTLESALKKRVGKDRPEVEPMEYTAAEYLARLS